eukprot:SAG11_NODE_1663_length_4496_cov_2.612236_3_plen_248_part_00
MCLRRLRRLRRLRLHLCLLLHLCASAASNAPRRLQRPRRLRLLRLTARRLCLTPPDMLDDEADEQLTVEDSAAVSKAQISGSKAAKRERLTQAQRNKRERCAAAAAHGRRRYNSRRRHYNRRRRHYNRRRRRHYNRRRRRRSVKLEGRRLVAAKKEKAMKVQLAVLGQTLKEVDGQLAAQVVTVKRKAAKRAAAQTRPLRMGKHRLKPGLLAAEVRRRRLRRARGERAPAAWGEALGALYSQRLTGR